MSRPFARYSLVHFAKRLTECLYSRKTLQLHQMQQISIFHTRDFPRTPQLTVLAEHVNRLCALPLLLPHHHYYYYHRSRVPSLARLLSSSRTDSRSRHRLYGSPVSPHHPVLPLLPLHPLQLQPLPHYHLPLPLDLLLLSLPRFLVEITR